MIIPDQELLIKYRIEQAKAVLKDAKTLLAYEGSLSSIINRSYYAMFYATLSLLAVLNKGTSKHSGVISLFDKYFVKESIISKERSKSLHRAFGLRQMADYNELMSVDVEDAQILIHEAEFFIKDIEKVLQEKYLVKL